MTSPGAVFMTIYRQIYQKIIDDIRSGKLKPGERLASIRKYADENAVAEAIYRQTECCILRFHDGTQHYDTQPLFKPAIFFGENRQSPENSGTENDRGKGFNRPLAKIKWMCYN